MKYIEYGKQNDEIIMMLHGGGLSWWNYRDEAEILCDDYHVILPIIDGHAGRTEEQKRKCANQIAEVIANTLGCETKSVSVAIKDVEQSEWKDEVWDRHIIPDEQFLYKKPGYSYDE